MIDTHLKNQLREIITKYLSPEEYRLFIFGSWAEGKQKQYSDIDIGILGDKPVHHLGKIQSDFEESDIPYVVDLIDFTNTSPEFRANALKHTEPL